MSVRIISNEPRIAKEVHPANISNLIPPFTIRTTLPTCSQLDFTRIFLLIHSQK
ncbi:hypothetical protein EVA_06133 [gut metagenome]|uniref:Uncharacterized protein n=1 Tax=gut metagenome TaxID=749906 RepID=J9GST0_9ZZZZ